MNEIEICGRELGQAHRPFVIAEIGINHEGDIEKAFRIVDDAARVGCECVKFQCHVIHDAKGICRIQRYDLLVQPFFEGSCGQAGKNGGWGL